MGGRCGLLLLLGCLLLRRCLLCGPCRIQLLHLSPSIRPLCAPPLPGTTTPATGSSSSGGSIMPCCLCPGSLHSCHSPPAPCTGSSSSSGGAITPDALIPRLRALAKDKGVAAVVLRVDSPGGDALASDLLWREIQVLGDKKPVVASMGDTAGGWAGRLVPGWW